MSKESNMLREIKITKNFTKQAEGSVLIEFGDTVVLCNASIEEKVPPFLKNTGTGWIVQNIPCFLDRLTKEKSEIQLEVKQMVELMKSKD